MLQKYSEYHGTQKQTGALFLHFRKYNSTHLNFLYRDKIDTIHFMV